MSTFAVICQIPDYDWVEVAPGKVVKAYRLIATSIRYKFVGQYENEDDARAALSTCYRGFVVTTS